MPELRERPLGVIDVRRRARGVWTGSLPRVTAARMLRVAPDELMVVASADVIDDVRRELHDRITALDDDALVIDVSDGWTAIWRSPARTPTAPFPTSPGSTRPADGLVQGDVARVAAKIVREPDGLLLLVPAYWGEHLRTRAIEDAGATEVPDVTGLLRHRTFLQRRDPSRATTS